MKRMLVVLGWCLLAFVAPWIILGAVNTAVGTPPTARKAEVCTRHCHNRGCPHEPVLPDAIAGDKGLYGDTIRALFAAGGTSGMGRRQGYGAVNLLAFVVLWPGLMLALLAIAIWQRQTIRGLRQEVVDEPEIG